MRKFSSLVIILSFVFTANAQIAGSYNVSGYFFHPTSSRSFNLIKSVTLVSPNVYQVDFADLASQGYSFRFSLDSANNMFNYVAVGAAPAAPASGLMNADNPGALTFAGTAQPGTAPWVHSVYNNKYNPNTGVFYMHYGYGSGSTSQNGYSRQVYEKWTPVAPAKITSVSPLTATALTQVTIRGRNFTNVDPTYSITFGGVRADSAAVISDTVILAWPAYGASGMVRVANTDGADSLGGFTYTPVGAVSTSPWTYVGAAGVSASKASFISSTLDKNNNIYAAYIDSATKKAMVMKYSANTWTTVGTDLSNAFASNTKIALDSSNNPIAAFTDTFGFINVKKYQSGSWTNLAIPTAKAPYALTVDAFGRIYVAAADTGRIKILYYNGSTWTVTANIARSIYGDMSMAIDKTTNNPYLLFDDYNFSGRASVMKYNGTAWSLVGAGGFSDGINGIFYPAIAVDKTGSPVVAFQDDNGFERVSLYKFNGTAWAPLAKRFSKSHSYRTSLALDKQNLPYVAYNDNSYNQFGSIMKVDLSGNINYTGQRGFLPSLLNQQLCLMVDTTDSPLIAFSDNSAGGKLSVMKIPAAPVFTPVSTNYKVSGYFFHPTTSRAINSTKAITQIAPNTYKVFMADLQANNQTFTFQIDSSNNLINFTATDATPAAPASGFMTTDNPGGTVFPVTPGPGTTPWLHSTYNNKYDPATGTFYMHYGYAVGSTGQTGYTRQIYEKWALPVPAKIFSVSPLTGTAFTKVTIVGKNFTTVAPAFGVSFGNVTADSAVVVSDSLIYAWVGSGGSGNVKVTNTDGSDTLAGFVYTPVAAVTNPQWNYVGTPGFTTNSALEVSTVVDRNNVQYVGYIDNTTRKAAVMKQVSGNWVKLFGDASTGKCSNLRLAVDSFNTVQVAYIDSSNFSRITVRKFLDTGWINVSLPFIRGSFSMAVDRSNKTHILSLDSGRVVVYMQTDTGYIASPSLGSSSDADITIDRKNNIPYIIYNDISTFAPTVKKFIGGSWVVVGSLNFITPSSGVFYPKIRIDNAGNPFAAFQEDNGFERASVYKFNGSTWIAVGQRISGSRSYHVNFALNRNNDPFIAFIDNSYNKRGTVRGIDHTPGVWDIIGKRGFIPAQSLGPNAFIIDSADAPVVAFSDIANGGKASVMRLNTNCYNDVNRWTGAVNSDWNNPGNWGCGIVPTPTSDVVVNPGATIVLSTNTTVNTITLSPGANLTIAAGSNLIIKEP